MHGGERLRNRLPRLDSFLYACLPSVVVSLQLGYLSVQADGVMGYVFQAHRAGMTEADTQPVASLLGLVDPRHPVPAGRCPVLEALGRAPVSEVRPMRNFAFHLGLVASLRERVQHPQVLEYLPI